MLVCYLQFVEEWQAIRNLYVLPYNCNPNLGRPRQNSYMVYCELFGYNVNFKPCATGNLASRC